MDNRNLKLLVCVFLIFLPSFGIVVLLSCAGDMGEVKWSFVVYSDNRGSNATHQAVLRSIAKIKPDIILNLGDVVYGFADYGTMDRFRKDIEECYGSFDNFVRIFYPSIGGHEERYYNQAQYPPNGKEPDNEAGRRFYHEVSLKDRVAEFNDEYGDYYFSHKGVHFIMLYRSDEWEFQDGQVRWLKSMLEKTGGEPVIVTGHGGLWFYPLSPNQKEIVKLMREYGVDIALAADIHDYYAEVAGSMMMLRSGSAGWGDGIFLRFDITDKGFIIKAFEPDGATFFTRRKDADGNVIHPYWFKGFGKTGQKVPY